jgi:hypothetical protein
MKDKPTVPNKPAILGVSGAVTTFLSPQGYIDLYNQLAKRLGPVIDCLTYLMERSPKTKWISCDKCSRLRYPTEEKCDCETTKADQWTPEELGNMKDAEPLKINTIPHEEISDAILAPWIAAAKDPKIAQRMKELLDEEMKKYRECEITVRKCKYCGHVHTIPLNCCGEKLL